MVSTFKVVVTARSFASTDQGPLRALEEAGAEVKLVRPDKRLGVDDMADLLAAVHAAIVGADPVTREVLARARRLKVVAMHGVGTDHIDVEAATEFGVVVTHAPGSNTAAVAELTIAFIFALARNLVHAHLSTSAGEWRRFVGVEVGGKTLGLVGLGRIGRAVAARAKALGMLVQGYDPFVDPVVAASEGVELVSLDILMRTSDFVSIHIPLNRDTELLIDAEMLDRMKPTAFLINTSRGRVVDERALAERLRSGRIAGAALDVFWNEPPVGSEIVRLPNVILTPHMGAHTAEAIRRMSEMAAQSVTDLMQGRVPPYVVNPEVLTRRCAKPAE